MENAINMKYNASAYVVQANELIRSKQDELSLVEAKLIRLAISQILMEDTDLKTYSCKASDLANYLDMPHGNIYRALDNITTNLMRKLIKIVDKTSTPKADGEYNYKTFHWVDYCEYKDKVVTIKLSESLKPYLIGLNALFTEYGYNSILALPTTNSIRLLELLKSYENLTTYRALTYDAINPYPDIEKANNELIFSVEHLKSYFNCADKYPNNSDFVKKVIDASVKAINTKSASHKVSYRVVKNGRSIAYVLFKVNAFDDVDFLKFITEE